MLAVIRKRKGERLAGQHLKVVMHKQVAYHLLFVALGRELVHEPVHIAGVVHVRVHIQIHVNGGIAVLHGGRVHGDQIAGEGQRRGQVKHGHVPPKPRGQGDFARFQIKQHKQRAGAPDRFSVRLKQEIAREKHVPRGSRPGAHRYRLPQDGVFVHLQMGAGEHPGHVQRSELLKRQVQKAALAVRRLLHGAEHRARLPVPRKIHRAHIQRCFVCKGFVHGFTSQSGFSRDGPVQNSIAYFLPKWSILL